MIIYIYFNQQPLLLIKRAQRLYVEQLSYAEQKTKSVLNSCETARYQDVAGAGVGIGVVFSGLITATARNPALRPLQN